MLAAREKIVQTPKAVTARETRWPRGDLRHRCPGEESQRDHDPDPGSRCASRSSGDRTGAVVMCIESISYDTRAVRNFTGAKRTKETSCRESRLFAITRNL